MNYIIIGLLLSIGWHISKVVFRAVEELLFERLHRTDWYLTIAGAKPVEETDRPGDAKRVKNRIGFHYVEKTES